jgi:hypothetical protein
LWVRASRCGNYITAAVSSKKNCGFDNGLRLFGIEVLDQLHRSVDVGE